MVLHYIIKDLQTQDFSSFTTVQGKFEDCVDDYMTNDWSEEEAEELEAEFAKMTTNQKIEWVERVYEYKFVADPDPETIKEWEDFTGRNWEKEKAEENTRQNGETWKNIFRNTAEANEEVEIVWLEGEAGGPGEYVLCCGCELFEDGFHSESEAQKRLDHLENLYYQEAE